MLNNIYLNRMDINILPKRWNDLKLKDYNKLIQADLIREDETAIEELNELDFQIAVISTLTDVSIGDLEALTVNELLPAIQSISFLYTPLEPVKTSLKAKDITALTYAEFTSYMQLQNQPFNNTNQILPIFFKELENIDVNELPITEVVGFFLELQKRLRKHLKRSQISLTKEILKQKLMFWRVKDKV